MLMAHLCLGISIGIHRAHLSVQILKSLLKSAILATCFGPPPESSIFNYSDCIKRVSCENL